MDDNPVTVSLHTAAEATTTRPVEDITWPSATGETIHSILVGDEVFVRPDWDAYRMGQLDILDKAIAALMHLPSWESRGAYHSIDLERATEALHALRPTP